MVHKIEIASSRVTNYATFLLDSSRCQKIR